MKFSTALFFVSALLGASTALASGFEKSIPWGGQTSGVAGIGTPYIQGSQALFFNPAGLASDKVGAQDVSLNLSPTFPTYKESGDASGTQYTSQSSALVPFSAMYGITLTDKIGIGIGGYVSGGTYADFQNLNFPGLTSAESKINVAINELAAGIGYKVMDGLKIGASYRVVAIKADLDLVNSLGGTHYAVAQDQNLKDTEYTGFKLGAQYKVNEKWELGLTYRSEVDFRTTGNETITTQAGTSTSGVSVNTMLPPATTLGADYKPTENWTVLGEYVFTQYSKITNITAVDNTSANVVQLQFKDQHNIRLAGEYKGWALPVRFGYIWTSQVTNQNYMLMGLTPPGSANTFTLGTGKTFNIGGQAVRADGGLEYTMVSGSSSATAAPGPVYTSGSNMVSEVAVHLGASYMF